MGLLIILLIICSIAKVEPAGRHKRLVGGKEVKEDKYPWMVAIYFEGKFVCGGTLITDRHVLTAAHCIVISGQVQKAENLHGHIGSVNRTSAEVTDLEFEQVLPHPGYNLTTMKWDIGILKTKFEVEFGENIQPICIARELYKSRVPEAAITMGWGSSTDKPPFKYEHMLQHSKLQLLENSLCNVTEKSFDKTNLCALGVKSSVVQGDSGGPLVTVDNKMILGIASYVSLVKKMIIIYMRVALAGDFIRNATEGSKVCWDKETP